MPTFPASEVIYMSISYSPLLYSKGLKCVSGHKHDQPKFISSCPCSVSLWWWPSNSPHLHQLYEPKQRRSYYQVWCIGPCALLQLLVSCCCGHCLEAKGEWCFWLVHPWPPKEQTFPFRQPSRICQLWLKPETKVGTAKNMNFTFAQYVVSTPTPTHLNPPFRQARIKVQGHTAVQQKKLKECANLVWDVAWRRVWEDRKVWRATYYLGFPSLLMKFLYSWMNRIHVNFQCRTCTVTNLLSHK